MIISELTKEGAMSYTVIMGIVIGIAFIGLIFSAKKQSTNSLAKPLVVIFTLVILTCGLLLLVDRLAPPDINQLVNNKLIFSKSAGYKLAKYISKTTPNASIILLTASTKANKAQEVLIEEMNKAFSKTNAKMTVVSLLKKQKTTTKSNRFTTKEFNKALKRFPKCNFVISSVGLPEKIQDLTILQKFIREPSKAPKVALLNCKVTDMAKLIKGGFICVVVYPNPKKKYSDDTPDSNDLMKTFDMRYLFITSKNMDQISKDFPGRIFKKAEK